MKVFKDYESFKESQPKLAEHKDVLEMINECDREYGIDYIPIYIFNDMSEFGSYIMDVEFFMPEHLEKLKKYMDLYSYGVDYLKSAKYAVDVDGYVVVLDV